MSEKILVPVLGESITEATIGKWLKKEGDLVEADEAIVELETDKVNLEVPSPIDGVLSEIKSKDGDTVEVGAVLGAISEGSAKSTEDKKTEKIEPVKVKDNVVNLDIEKNEPRIFEEEIIEKEVKNLEPLILTDEVKVDKVNTTSNNREILSPAVRKIVEENKIDLTKIEGTGNEGCVLKCDLLSLM